MNINMVRIQRWVSTTIALACVTLLIIISLVGYTTFGLSLALRSINLSMPNTISYTGLAGTLVQGAHIDNLIIHHPNMEIQLEDLTFEMHLLDLMTGNIHIKNIVTPRIYLPQYPNLLLSGVAANANISSDNIQIDAQYTLPHYHVSQQLELQGTLDAYHLTLHNLIGKKTFTLTGSGNRTKLALEGKDTMEFHLSADWQHDLQLYLQMNGKFQIPQLQTEIGINHLVIALDGPNANIQIPGIEGIWQGKPLLIKGEGQIQDNQYQGNLNLQYEKNALQAKGSLGKTLSIQGETHILDLSNFLPGVGGKVTIQTTLTGNPNNPDTKVHYTVEDFIYQTNHIEKAHGTFMLHADQAVEAHLTIDNAIIGYYEIQQADVALTGNMQQHQLSLSVINDASKISALVEGSYAQPTWAGRIKNLTISTAKNTLQTPQPIPLSYQGHRIQYHNFCLQDKKQASLCLQGYIDLASQAWENTIDLRSFSLESLGDIPLGTEAIIKGGVLQGHLSAQGTGSTILNKSGQLTIQDLLVYLAEQNNELWLQKGNIKIDKQQIALTLDSKRQNHHFHVQATCHGSHCEGAIHGENVPLSKTKTLRLVADPNLQFSLKNYRIHMQGEVHVHDSTISVQTHSNALTLPNDVHIIKPDAKQSADPLISLDPSSNLRVILGKNIDIIITNTTGKLEGEIAMTFPEESPPLCNGKIRLIDGKYKGYGQRLKIHTGDISYSNSLIDNPTIDIIAVKNVQLNDDTFDLRNLEEDKVGIRITGTAENPVINLFSYPDQLPEDEILSLLITGQKTAFSEGGVNGSSLSPYMLGSYLLETTGSLTGISKMLSLDTIHIFDSTSHSSGSPSGFTVKTKDDSMKILVTKHINKRFSINGNFDIYSNEYKLSAQYKITPHLSIKTYVGDFSEGVNLIYKIESNH